MKSREDLRRHIAASYFAMRLGLVIIGFTFPVLLVLGGYLQGVEPQASMSAYYHATGPSGGDMRDWFVGVLFAVAALLYLYKGFSLLENVLLNGAGVFAVGVAVFPTEWGCGDSCQTITMHGTSAVLFFLCIAAVCLFSASDTLDQLDDEARRKAYRRRYTTLGILMIASPLAAFAWTNVVDQTGRFVFFVEAFGIWVFAAYWLTKTLELSVTHADREALKGRLSPTDLRRTR